jgi:polysaccharide transporter, PST family
MLGRRAFAVIIGFLTAVIMPHYLTPAAYGLATMTVLVFTLGEIFKDFGLGSALLRKGNIDPEEMTFLFWFNIGTTAIISAIIAVTAPLVAMFFNQPLVAKIILFSLIGFIVSGASMQHRGLLNRDLRFAEIAMIDSISISFQFALTLLLAVLKFGVWAIVAGNILNNSVNALLCIVYSRWKPGRPRIIKEFRAIVGFGANTATYSLALFFSTNITPILIGNTQSVSSLGQYNMANVFLSLPLKNLVEPLAQATLPVLARLRPFPAIYRETYLTFLQRLNLAVLPASVFLLFAARPLIEAALGAKWREAGDLLAILAPVVGVLGFGYAVSDLFITQNRSRELRTLGLAEAAFRISAVFIGVRFGLYFAAGAYAFATVVVVVIRVYVAGLRGPVGFRDHLRTVLPSLPIMVGTALGCWAGGSLATHLSWSTTAEASMIGSTGIGFAIVTALSVGSSRKALYELVKSMRVSAATVQTTDQM